MRYPTWKCPNCGTIVRKEDRKYKRVEKRKNVWITVICCIECKNNIEEKQYE